ncbi:MAG TPA: NAD(P)H-quinone oxidoreductase [Thermoanaerobaculia bacterium]|nr:NAD(P)H-quinone oxidoreductase [Thermoanaerobaculia bacterium]
MRAVLFDHPGDESVLRVGEAEAPPIGPGHVRIRVATTAVNRADLLQRAGHYPPPAGASPILGLECAGTVIECGADASAFSPGDRVMALLPGGGYAEEAVVDAGSVMRVPAALSDEEAGALPEAFLTAYLNVFDLARARAGETLLIHGGGGGVGTATTTLGKLAGLRVIVTAGSAEKCRRCVEHGADEAINYKKDDFVRRVSDADVVLDHVGARYLTRDLQVLRSGGRVVVIGGMGGTTMASIDVGSLLAKRQQIIGSTLRARPAAEKGEIVRGFLERFGPDLEAGRIRPVIHAVFPLEEATEAHRLMKASKHFGKLVLRISGASGSTAPPRS